MSNSGAPNRFEKEYGQNRTDKITAQRAPNDRIVQDVQIGYERLIVADAVDSVNATTNVITAAAHIAQVGDVIQFTSGSISGKRAVVIEKDTNTLTLGQSVTGCAAADTFNILREQPARVDASGQPGLVVAGVPLYGALAFGSLTNAYAAFVANAGAAVIRGIYFSSTLDKDALLSLDGTNDFIEVQAGRTGFIDLASMGIKHAGPITAKYIAAPGSGRLTATGIV